MQADIGIIGGSGFYSLLEETEDITIDTPYGKTSDVISTGTISGKRVAFLPRHGRRHTIPPHKVPYRANIDALNTLGVKRIIATNALGSLKEEYAPGNFVLFDQFVNMTHGRADTFFDADIVAHVSPANPYCEDMREAAFSLAKDLNMGMHKKGTVVVVNGPRFSTTAESRFFNKQGFDVINMTQYPEVMLAKEKGICYLGIGIVTDYDVGIEGREDIKPVNAEEVNKVFAQSVDKAKRLVSELIPKISDTRENCNCAKSLEGAIVTH